MGYFGLFWAILGYWAMVANWAYLDPSVTLLAPFLQPGALRAAQAGCVGGGCVGAVLVVHSDREPAALGAWVSAV